MVTSTDSPFSEIANRCGFRNVSHLCRISKKSAHGCTMGSLRPPPDRRGFSRLDC